MNAHIRQISDELLEAYGELKRFLANRLRNAEDAADVAQSSFERVYAHALAAPVASPRALLFSAARNLCIDLARHRTIARAWLDERIALDAAESAPSVEHLVAQRQRIERVVACLEELPARRREVFLLARVYGHTRQEIAARLSITEAAVAKHLVRATLDCARVLADLMQP